MQGRGRADDSVSQNAQRNFSWNLAAPLGDAAPHAVPRVPPRHRRPLSPSEALSCPRQKSKCIPSSLIDLCRYFHACTLSNVFLPQRHFRATPKKFPGIKRRPCVETCCRSEGRLRQTEEEEYAHRPTDAQSSCALARRALESELRRHARKFIAV